jgi:hypothetical protein
MIAVLHSDDNSQEARDFGHGLDFIEQRRNQGPTT